MIPPPVQSAPTRLKNWLSDKVSVSAPELSVNLAGVTVKTKLNSDDMALCRAIYSRFDNSTCTGPMNDDTPLKWSYDERGKQLTEGIVLSIANTVEFIQVEIIKAQSNGKTISPELILLCSRFVKDEDVRDPVRRYTAMMNTPEYKEGDKKCREQVINGMKIAQAKCLKMYEKLGVLGKIKLHETHLNDTAKAFKKHEQKHGEPYFRPEHNAPQWLIDKMNALDKQHKGVESL